MGGGARGAGSGWNLLSRSNGGVLQRGGGEIGGGLLDKLTPLDTDLSRKSALMKGRRLEPLSLPEITHITRQVNLLLLEHR